jgi:hypothetical protein
MQVREILQEEEDLSEIVQLVGKVSLFSSIYLYREPVERCLSLLPALCNRVTFQGVRKHSV